MAELADAPDPTESIVESSGTGSWPFTTDGVAVDVVSAAWQLRRYGSFQELCEEGRWVNVGDRRSRARLPFQNSRQTLPLPLLTPHQCTPILYPPQHVNWNHIWT